MTLLQRFKRLTLWNKLGVIASIVGIVTFIAWLIPERPKPHPHFALSLQIGDSSASTVLLTNDFLFSEHIVKSGDLPNGNILFNSHANGCLVIPLKPAESNIVFNLMVENDSSVKVSDLAVAMGFPKDWECGLDSTKWRPVGQHLIIAGWKLQSTNIQYWSAESPWPLFPSDSVAFPPITNFSIPEFNSPTNKNGILELNVRSTDFESLVAANVLFVRITTNSFKPFITKMQLGKDGFWRVLISQKEFEDSQK